MLKAILSLARTARAPAGVVDAGSASSSRAAPSRPLPTRFLDVEGGVVAFDDTGGDGPVVLAIPGMGDLRAQYRMLTPILREAGFRVITMDVRGFGETSPRWSDYSARAVGRDAVSLLARLDAGPAVMLGNSFAAGAALWAARDAPERVRGAVLLGPIVRDGQPSRLALAALRLGFAGPWRVWFWTAYWNSLFPTRKPFDQARARAALADNLREPGRMEALRIMVGLSKRDTESMLALSEVPALVIMGTRDADFPDATAEAHWVTTQIKGKTLLVDGAGHYPHTEMPEVVAPEILAFIESLPDRRGSGGEPG
ncbi:alpha/beta fold hydrolase [Burkholderia plantarii]|uniref:alpha/beta fold hydrolase n=1 Tax=Burkholderia plantarii TaxID=41899 RepID=UPI0018DDBE8D|nr:alpha/beta hydrolase [Burkholderia plantarii]MBI0328333.1 alpha/beta hydrolase [Burkholderia plantarii]